MKRKLLLLSVMFLWTWSSFGQSAIIGTGTSTTNGTAADPIERYYNYTHYQIVYTATELTTAGISPGATIDAMGFSVSESAVSLSNFTIDMGHTTQATADPYISTGLSTVKASFTYTPVVQDAGSFDMITLDAGFIWDGSSNIVINTCTGSNSYTSPYGGLRYSTGTNGSARYVRDDGASNCSFETETSTTSRPNIKFEFTPAAGGVDNPASFNSVAASSSEIDVDWTLNGSSNNVLVAWSSDGTFGTPVDGSTYSAGNSITGGGTVLYYGSALHYDHNSLNSNTQYFYKAWSYSGSEYSFGTIDDATTDFAFVSQALPFTEVFETNLDVWYLSGTTTPELSTTQFHDGSKSLSFNTTTSTNSSVTVQLGLGTNPMLTFWYYIDYYYSNDLTVDIKEAGASTWTTVIWQETTDYNTDDTVRSRS